MKFFSRSVQKVSVSAIAIVALYCSCQSFQVPEIKRIEPTSTFTTNDDMNSIAHCLAQAVSLYHYQNPKIDDDFSNKVFTKYLSIIDPMHILLTEEDINALSTYKNKIDDELTQGNLEFAYVAGKIAQQRAHEFINFSHECMKQEMDCFENDTFPREIKLENAPKAKDQAKLWAKFIKNELIKITLENRAFKEGIEIEKGKKISPFIANLPIKERLESRLQQYMWSLENATTSTLAESFLLSFTLCCDPHCTYASPKEFSRNNSMISLNFAGIGLSYSMRNGYCEIGTITKNGPVAKQGNLIKSGDIILSVKENDKEQVLVGLPTERISDYLRGPIGTKISVKILDGSQINPQPKWIDIIRGPVSTPSLQASGKIVTHQDANGKSYKIGVIDLPIFYFDQVRNKGASDDIKDLLQDFEKAGGVDGVILDLRSNPGGLLEQAIKVTGLFIKKGPVVQVSQNKNIRILKDANPQIYYDGPMLVMINKMSASASEIVSGALKDYKRAVIVGEKQSFGKGTVQSVINLNQIAYVTDKKLPQDPGGLNLTIQMFHRPLGDSTQFKGVESDIFFPSYSDVIKKLGEQHEEHAIPFKKVKKVVIENETQNVENFLPELRQKSMTRTANNANFIKLKEMIQEFNEIINSDQISLNEETRWSMFLRELALSNDQISLFKVRDYDDDEKISTKTSKKDIFLDESLMIISDLVQLTKASENSSK